jgi:hypothetical protein
METLASYNMENMKNGSACGMMLHINMSMHERG